MTTGYFSTRRAMLFSSLIGFLFIFCISLPSFSSVSLSCDKIFVARTLESSTDKGYHVEDYPDIASSYQQVVNMVSSETSRPLLSIIVPAYREALRLPQSVQRMKNFFDKYPLPIEILIIAQKSPDDTLPVALNSVHGDERFQVFDKPKEDGLKKVSEGKGSTVRYGMQKARGEYVLFMDTDLSTPLPEIFNFLVHLKNHPRTSVVIGERGQFSQSEEGGRNPIRRVMSLTFNTLVRWVSIEGIHDTQCGFKIFTREASKEIFALQSLSGFAFDVEVLLLAERLGFATDVLPVQWTDTEGSTVHKFWDPLKMFADLIKIRNLVEDNVNKRETL